MINNLRKSFLLLALFYIGVIILTPVTVSAESTKSSEVVPEGSSKFYYKVIKPSNQKSDVGYFDLKMNPGQKQTVQIEFSNYSDVQIGIQLGVNSAKTNSNGVIEYTFNEIKKDASLKYDIEKIVKGPKNVILEAGETKRADFEITMPSEKFDGEIAGGIFLQQMDSKKDKEAEKKATGIKNKYAYIIGMLLSETDTIVEPDLKLNKIAAGLQNYRNAVVVNFSNIEMVYLEKMTVEAQIMKNGSDEILYDTKKANLRMAPNSMIEFPVSMNGDRMDSGDYVGHVLVTSGDKKWEWKEKFKITKEEADKYNAKDVSLTQDKSFNWLIIALVVVVLMVVIVIIFFSVRKLSSRKKKKAKKKRISKKR